MVRRRACRALALHLLVAGCCPRVGWAKAAVFDVRAYGAVGDGQTPDTAAVRAAAAALAAAGGGVLLFPATSNSGEPTQYLTGSFNLSSNARLRVEAGAVVLGSRTGSDWPLLDAAEVWPQYGHGSDCPVGKESCRLMHQALVFGWKVGNVSIEGGGTIDCNADVHGWWKCAKDLSQPPCSGYARPHCVMLSDAAAVSLNNVTVRNSPDWTLHFSSVAGLHVSGVRVVNPHTAPNSDGIDVDSCQDVVVEDSYFSVGDDALCVKSGLDYFGRLYGKPSKNVLFQRIQIGSGHGISVGSETSGSITNVTFRDISMSGTNVGVRIKSARGRGGVVSGLRYHNITMRHIQQQCVQITMNYVESVPPTNATATPVFRDIELQDVHCDGARVGFFLDGLPESRIEGLTFNRVVVLDVAKRESACHYVDCICDSTTQQCPSCCRPGGPEADIVTV